MTQDAVKLCIIGDSGVGKTCISSRLVDGTFKSDEKSTIGASFVTTNIENSKIVIWDTAGQEKYRSMVGMYYRGASGAIIVYDITSRATFVDLDAWHADLMKTATDDIVLCIVGNKSDLEASRQVSTDEGKEFASKKNAMFYEVSAMNGKNVTELFTEITRKIKSSQPQKPQGGLSSSDNVNVATASTQPTKKKGFC
ncbi:GTP-binding protein YPT31/YPT8, putative [Entamoeba dispar SAW760]|uniref:GTP-binding protein YPT31/YPT8, putative n=1 Tax=Entamoeba dispar (strain ATCC PRA-260 / SAW760) TaxID=370354 RepID=B0EL58_ENTDS|nr:GTP-binding protein YPT31/YPT8, putative [Entamoeba dispar SAW760]EDR24746.1 GTP-binding protein YPT31/YPT8, putative [Entamoeba dispar SAW760]|eukprot:EDR24746.1 GTP-binding protein YPT31/YPT8, putative [Entamoeba dispar SAW760]